MSDALQKGEGNSLDKRTRSFKYIPGHNIDMEVPESNPLDPKRLVKLILRYKWVILLFLIVGSTAAWFYADWVSPVYESKGSLLISSSGGFTNDELKQIISQTTGYGTSSTLENELQVLGSRKFAGQIAKKLIADNPGNIDEFPILWKVEDNGSIHPAGEEAITSRITSHLEFRQPKEKSDVVEISFKSRSPLESAKIVNEAMDIYVENSTRQNRQAAASTAEFLKQEKERIKLKLQESEERLRRYMDSTGIVQEGQQATGLVTQRVNTEAELQRVNLELETINQTIDKYEHRLDEIKPGLSDQFSEAIGPRIQRAQDELAGYESERTMIITKNPGVLQRKPVPPRLKYLDDQIARLKAEIKDLSQQLFTGDGQFLGMDSEDRAMMVSDIQSHLSDLIIQQKQYLAKRDTLEHQRQELIASFNALPEGMIELSKLKRDVKINEELYMNVSRQYADMSVWKQSQFGFGRIIDYGQVPDIPVSPNKKIILLLGIMLSGFFSAGFIAIREFMDNSVKSVDQLKTIYLPSQSFSVIPTFEKVSKKNKKKFSKGHGEIPDEVVLLNNRTSLASESIRRLKNNIIYQHGDFPPKTIAVTSPEKGDGKSTIVTNLGIAFAEEGYKTLIIDADFRRPKLHKYLGLTDNTGLSDYLNAKIPIDQLIQNTDLQYLKVIAAGKGIERPDVIGSSITFKQLLKKMETIFNVIILDTPPFGVISDSTPILKGVESTLVVVRYGITNKGMLLRTIEELERIQANVSEIVLNDFNYKKDSDYYGVGYYQTLHSNYETYVK